MPHCPYLGRKRESPEPCNGRLLRTVLWEPGGAIPPGDPALNPAMRPIPDDLTRAHEVWHSTYRRLAFRFGS
ncbi:hypothetical protein SGPA1_22025 [Streptomyces misionensis JCM 4497]